MIHDPDLLERLAELPAEPFSGTAFRATRRGLEPTAASTAGGRWSPPDGPAVLYTSLHRDGALAEIAFHWALLTPRPTKPALLHELRLGTERTLRLLRSSLQALGVDDEGLASLDYGRTQEIGAAVAFLNCDGLIVPSARWSCDNLIVFTDNFSMTLDIEVVRTDEVDWQAWARERGGLGEV